MIGLRDDNALPAPDRWESHVPRLFAAGGWLCAGQALDHRKQQEQMALAVAEQFSLNRSLLVEAGTGVGKSLAYLLPGILRAVDADRQLVVSTHTISLQEQIELKDLPLCRSIFGAHEELHPYRDFMSALLVGKGNYLCTTRLRKALAEKTDLFGSADSLEVQRIAEWSGGTRTGLKHELSPPPRPDVWDLVSADSGACSRHNCSPDSCFYQRAKARLAEADVVIVNHSLLFALLQHGGGAATAAGDEEGGGEPGETAGILLPDDFLVLDEGHTVPEVATNHLGLALSSFGLQRILHTLYHPERDRGLLKRIGLPREREAVGEALVAAEGYFNQILANQLEKHNLVRVRDGETLDSGLEVPLRKVIQTLEGVASRMDAGPGLDELKDYQRRLTGWRAGLIQFCAEPEPMEVHWLERTGRRYPIVNFRTAPLDVAPALRELLFQRNTSVIVTSATLAAGRDLRGFAASIGALGTRLEQLSSPFDYERLMTVNIAEDMPEPTAEGRRLNLEWLADMLAWCVGRVEGGALVLFTSHQDLLSCEQRLLSEAAALGRPIFVQGREHSRTELTRRFRAAGNGILMGTDSFWTGVDVPGPALSHVILVRLPFEHPSHPVAEARSEWVRERGGNPFGELQLPSALRMFRQGVGRLVRSYTDRGVVTILDSRILTKTYGRHFLDCLPVRAYQRFRRDNRDSRFQIPD